MLVDTHAHPEQADYNADRDEVIKTAFNEGLSAIIAVGTNIENSKKVIELSKQFDMIFPTVGIHPRDGVTDTKRDYKANFEDLVKTNLERVVGIGECGIDKFIGEENRTSLQEIKQQIKVFEFQAELSKAYNLPLIIHCRNGWKEVFEVIDKKDVTGGVFHCWTGGINEAKEALSRGFYIAFGGILTFKNAGQIVEAAKYTELDRIVLETDSPFLAPEGMRGKRNEPKNVKIIAQFMAKLRGVELREIEEITTNNAKRLFKLNI